MFRFKASFAAYFAAALICTLILLSGNPVRGLWMAGSGILLAALGIVLLNSSPFFSLKRLGLSLLVLSLGLYFGLIRAAPLTRIGRAVFRYPPSVGLQLRSVSGFRGYLMQDSFVSRRGNTIYKLRLASVHSKMKDLSTEARGEAIVVVPDGPKLYLGRMVRVRAGLFVSGSLSGDHYMCHTTADRVEPGIFPNSFLRMRSSLRRFLNRQLLSLDAPVRALILALIFGDREEVPEDLYDKFRTSGSLHILALSGLHLGILLGLVIFLFSFIHSRGIKLLIGAILGLFYLFLVGPRPSLLRAVIMLLCGGVGLLLDRDPDPLNSLALAASIILLFDPSSIFSLSFQLSFLAMLGIILIGPVISGFIKPYIPPFLSLPLAYSLGAQIATAPVLLARFGVVFPVGVLAALVLIPLVTVFIWSGLLYLMVNVLTIPIIGQACSWLLDRLYAVLNGFIGVCSRVPGIRFSRMEYFWLLLMAIIIPALILVPTRRSLS